MEKEQKKIITENGSERIICCMHNIYLAFIKASIYVHMGEVTENKDFLYKKEKSPFLIWFKRSKPVIYKKQNNWYKECIISSSSEHVMMFCIKSIVGMKTSLILIRI